MRELVARTLFGTGLDRLRAHLETLPCDRRVLAGMLDALRELVDGSLHYNTASEERQFLIDAAAFVNFEGATLFNRTVITESPERVTELIRGHVFDKFGPLEVVPVRLVSEVDRLDAELAGEMRASPNHVFVVPVTRIPHGAFSDADRWEGLIGRLILVDVSTRARRSNTTIVYTLFPHVARTLGNVQTRLAGRPASTQLTLRRILERFSPAALAGLRAGVAARVDELAAARAFEVTVEELRASEWRRGALFDALALGKLRRALAFLERIAAADDRELDGLGAALRQSVAAAWMRYFYGGLDPAEYRAAVLPGGGRGALRLVGEHHRAYVRAEVARFLAEDLTGCQERLAALRAQLAIPAGSSDEIEAAIAQSRLRALSPAQWKPTAEAASLGGYLQRTFAYRLADLASRLTRTTQLGVDRAAFGNLAGPAAALLETTLSRAGLGALHGHLEAKVVDRALELDRKLRTALAPVQQALREATHAADDARGHLDPVAIGEIEAVLQLAQRQSFAPILVLPEMSWTYEDVFPEKDFPRASTIRVPLNDRHELDPGALLARIEELRYRFRGFPEIFRLFCRSMLLVVNSPHNPTGVVWRRETVLGILAIAAEFDIAVVDDNSYHRILTGQRKAREGDLCVAQVYERYRAHLGRPVRIHTVGATTKALQGAGDRTGLLHSNQPEVVAAAERAASRPHLLSLYMTQLKLESGLACKRWVRELEQLAADLVTPGTHTPPWEVLEALLARELGSLRDEAAPVAAFQVLLDGYEELLRLRQRGVSVADLSRAVSALVARLKQLRLEKRLVQDVEQRLAALEQARTRALAGREHIVPEGAFYHCFRLCPAGDDRGVLEFLAALARHRKVDVSYAGAGFVRVSLGGDLPGGAAGYERYGRALEIYLGALFRSWEAFDRGGRDIAGLDALFDGADPVQALWDDVGALAALAPAQPGPAGTAIEPSERGIVHCIEEGRSVADKIFIDRAGCEDVEDVLQSRVFRVVYRRLLRKVYRRVPALAELGREHAENQYGPLACLAAYRDRQLIDDVFRALLRELYREWHGPGSVKVLFTPLQAAKHAEKVAALHGLDRRVNDLINELLSAFGASKGARLATSTFAIGCEALAGVRAHDALPGYLRRVIEATAFAGATTGIDPRPSYVTGAAKRVADHRYGFTRREARAIESGNRNVLALGDGPPLAYFHDRLAAFAERADPADYVCKAEQVGPYRMLVVIHRACFHLISDELRLYPQIEEVQLRDSVDGVAWDGVMLFGIPVSVMGDAWKTGYVLDRRKDGALFPTAWVAREDAADYVGFFKKTLLTLHNERVKAMGGMPVHGAMITITFKNGLRKTLVFTADSGTGKSETITAMMEQLISASGPAAELLRIDILSGDMLSLWRGEDGQIYAFGTETGDFLRLTDITESWKSRFGDLLERGSYSNIDHPRNPRVTIPGICDARKLLSPTRVNCFFYIDNYSAPAVSAVEPSDDPDWVLRHVLVRGLRKNKGTSGDQPSLRAGLEIAGRSDVVTHFRHAIDDLLEWQDRELDGEPRTCLAYRDGASDVYAATDVVAAAFRGARIVHAGKPDQVLGVEHDALRNLYWLRCGGGRVVLDREVYDQVYEPIVGTFCGNPFVDPEGMDRVLATFAATMAAARCRPACSRPSSRATATSTPARPGQRATSSRSCSRTRRSTRGSSATRTRCSGRWSARSAACCRPAPTSPSSSRATTCSCSRPTSPPTSRSATSTARRSRCRPRTTGWSRSPRGRARRSPRRWRCRRWSWRSATSVRTPTTIWISASSRPTCGATTGSGAGAGSRSSSTRCCSSTGW